MSIDSSLGVSRDAIAELCHRRGIRRLAVFGSALRPDFRPDSDVDVLVEFDAGRTPGFAFFDIQDELSRLFGRQVDLSTPDFLNERIRERVRARRRSCLPATDAGHLRCEHECFPPEVLVVPARPPCHLARCRSLDVRKPRPPKRFGTLVSGR